MSVPLLLSYLNAVLFCSNISNTEQPETKVMTLKNANNIKVLANLKGDKKMYKRCESNVLEATDIQIEICG